MAAHPASWTVDPDPRATGSRILFPWRTVQVGIFDCWPGDERWGRVNHVDEGHIIAFPGTAVEIAQDGRPPLVADPSRVVLYNRDQTYRRAMVSGSGDHCSFLVVAPDLLEELASAGVAAGPDVIHRPFPVAATPIGRAEHLEQRALLHLLARAEPWRQPEVQERMVGLVARVLRRLAGAAPPRRTCRSATAREHARLVEAARAVLATDLARPMGLDEVAERTGASVFHLSRIFRQRTGTTMHAYRDQLRLRTGLGWVLEGSRRLTDVALELGFASHSHFTDRFRSAYGIAPSDVRARARAGSSF